MVAQLEVPLGTKAAPDLQGLYSLVDESRIEWAKHSVVALCTLAVPCPAAGGSKELFLPQKS
jgi:hypothetical protein